MPRMRPPISTCIPWIESRTPTDPVAITGQAVLLNNHGKLVGIGRVGLVFCPFAKEVDDSDDRTPEFFKGFCIEDFDLFRSTVVACPIVVCSTRLV